MDFFVSRAMQVGYMDDSQLRALHAKERDRGTCFANFEIQRMFGLSTVKDRWLIPDDNGAQEIHAQRVKMELLTSKVARNEVVTLYKDNHEKKDFNLPPWENLTIGNLESVHAFDARVLDAVNDMKISLVFSGAGAGKSSLRDRAKASRVLA